ncbi:ATP synthase F1 subunit delta [Sodalinema gerasimenkoae]|uniref:ATP synthase F1 subunit delta n=1 Tax=Sodalinema gerasimenkoae TaxID=2862348 RepID=UPI00135BF98E|nr:ATP synthase F1 subunit delta [Sodalinema gerasimenkoae]
MTGQMATAEIVEPYAKALMAIATEHDLVDVIGEDTAQILDTLKSSEELRQFITNPIIKPATKKAVLAQLFEGQVHDYMFRFLRLLVDRGRILFLQEICAQYQVLLRELKNIALAEVTSAVELSDGQREQVRDRVKVFTNASDVELQIEVDPTLLGGVIIRVGSKVLDLSLRGQLRRLALSLS